MRRVAALCGPMLVGLLACSAPAAPRFGGPEWSARAHRALDLYTVADRSLERDLLTARTGLLREYDPVVNDVASAGRAVAELEALAGREEPLAAAVREVADCLRRRRTLVEDFKTNNALLQNSLARIALLANASDRSARPGGTRRQAIAAGVLQLTLDPGPDAAGRLQALLSSSAPDVDGSDLHSHGELLAQVLPRTNALLLDFRAVPVDARIGVVRRRLADIEAADGSRRRTAESLAAAAAALAAVMLPAAAAYAALRTRRLRRRAENEHLAAAVTTLLLDSSSPTPQARIGHALARLAEPLGATRAFLQRSGAAPAFFAWAGPGAAALDGAKAAAFGESGAPGATARRTTVVLRAQDPCVTVGFDAEGRPVRPRPDLQPGMAAALAALVEAVEQDRRDEERLELERSLAEARRLQTVGAIASGVAHNFNNILGAISGFGEMAEAHAEPASPISRNLDEIRLAVDRARSLVDQVLAFGRRSRAPRRLVELGPLLAETLRLLEASLPAAVRVEISGTGGDQRVWCDPAGLQQVVLNLCHNAAQAMHGRGRIHVSTATRRIVNRTALSHGTAAPGRYVLLSVADSGDGVSAARMPRLFEPFFTTREGGTGLGLSTAAEIVGDLGGVIGVTSSPGHGAEFQVWLPTAPQTRPADAEPARDPATGREGAGIALERRPAAAAASNDHEGED